MKTDIDSQAAHWVTRIDGAGLSPAEEQELETWLAQDARHRGAFARAQAVMAHFDRAAALGAHYEPSRYTTESDAAWRKPAFRRRAMLAALAAGVAVTVLGIGFFLADRPHEMVTQRGEVRWIPLADGSAVTLNTATRLAVSYSDALRDVELVEGEAFFNVAKDANRPFVVQAGETRVRAVGTSFTVRHLEGEPVKVVVREGVVEVTPSDASSAVLLKANEVAYSSRAKTTKAGSLPRDELSRQLAWRQGMISLDGMTLARAAAEFGRYSQIKIVIEDPAIASRTVTGLFSASDPVGFAQAIATSMSLQAVIEADAVYLRQ